MENGTGNASNSTEHEMQGGKDPCQQFAPFMEIRLPLVSFGSAIAVLSALQNSVIFYLLFSRPSLRNSHFLHFAFLALCDILVALSYLAIMFLQVLMEHYRSPVLSTLWHGYLRPIFTLSNVALVASTYLIISATLERALSSLHLRFNVTPPRRLCMIISAFFIALVLKGTMFFEYELTYQENCTNHNIYLVGHTELAKNQLYNDFMFISRHFFCIFFPFFLLAYLNISIVRSLRRETGERDMSRGTRKDVQAATRLLVFVVTCYLSTQTLSVVMAFWEHIDIEGMYEQHAKFVALSVDIVSLLAVLSAAIRLEVYAWTSPQLRRELKTLRDEVSQRFCRKSPHGSFRPLRLQSHFSNGKVDPPHVHLQVHTEGKTGKAQTRPLQPLTTYSTDLQSLSLLAGESDKANVINSLDLVEVAV